MILEILLAATYKTKKKCQTVLRNFKKNHFISLPQQQFPVPIQRFHRVADRQ